MKSIQVILDTFFSPRKAFEAIREKPYILVILLLMAILTAATSYVVISKLDMTTVRSEIRTAMEKRMGGEVPEEQLENIVQMQTKMMKFAPVIGTVFSILAYLVMGLVFFLLFKLLDTEVSYGQSLSTTLHALLPNAISAIVAVVIAFAKGSVGPLEARNLVASNPAFLVDPKEQAVLYSFLASIDLFAIWSLVLLILGFATVSGKKAKQVAPWMIGLWILYVGVKVGWVALFGQ